MIIINLPDYKQNGESAVICLHFQRIVFIRNYNGGLENVMNN